MLPGDLPDKRADDRIDCRAFDFDLGETMGQRSRPGAADHYEVIRVTRKHSVVKSLFDEYFPNSPNLPLMKGEPSPVPQSNQFFGAETLFSLVDLIRPPGTWSSRPRGIPENVDLQKPDLFGDPRGGFKLLSRFAGKPDYDVGA